MKPLHFGLATLLNVLLVLVAHASDVAGSKDHPVVSRYAGSEILKYEEKDFDSFSLPTGQVRDRRSGATASQGESRTAVWSWWPGRASTFTGSPPR